LAPLVVVVEAEFVVEVEQAVNQAAQARRRTMR
jgi:hypothetical protein